ncbi:DUF3806 domain-containing protein [Plebeiibacterium sediminum]|uniref:DUF3806 domain-containing protein n=1 Tax=Plebeiibacterium sediminum TaxID=2992112 RepID=A0AAE3SEA7_9BACT|nr:DUF3806 domain-containing protein [Plebeiobacterium sediminum]MCW3786298.1 DUF3806 domain-containing protein [Plebeiobacterium sediminum]
MIFGFNRCKSDKEFQDVFLGSGSYFIRISKQYLTEEDEDGTVLLYPKGSECITLRFDILIFEPKDNNVKPITGYDFVVRNADKKDTKLYFENDFAIAFKESTSIENGTNLIMKFWEIGLQDNRTIIMSATILEKKQKDKRVKKLLASIPDLIKSIEPAKIQGSVETSSGIVNYTTTRQEPIDQKITLLNDSDKEFIKNWLKNGKNIIQYYNPDYNQNQNDLTLELLDSTFATWINSTQDDKFSSDSIANGLGVVYGDLLSKELNMTWVKVIDQYGEDYGVRALDNFTSFPISSVYKRIDSEEIGFFTNIYEMLKHTIETRNEK